MLLRLEQMAEFLVQEGPWGLEVRVEAGMEDANSCDL